MSNYSGIFSVHLFRNYIFYTKLICVIFPICWPNSISSVRMRFPVSVRSLEQLIREKRTVVTKVQYISRIYGPSNPELRSFRISLVLLNSIQCVSRVPQSISVVWRCPRFCHSCSIAIRVFLHLSTTAVSVLVLL